MDEITVHVTKKGKRKFLPTYLDDPVTGKRERQSTKESDRRLAEKAAGKWEAELREGRYKRKTNYTWEEFRDEYLDSLADAPIATVKSYTTAINTTAKHLKINRLA